MIRLRSIVHLARRTAFWLCCLMAVVCFAAMVWNVWYVGNVTYYVERPESAMCADERDPNDASSERLWTVWCGKGVVQFKIEKANRIFGVLEEAGPPAGLTYDMYNLAEYSGAPEEWLNLLNPAATTRLAIERTSVDNAPRAVCLPLFVLANVFALWPAIHVWLRWRSKRKATA